MERLSRFDLDEIEDSYERYKCNMASYETRIYAEKQLSRICLDLFISRFELAQIVKGFKKIREFEGGKK